MEDHIWKIAKAQRAEGMAPSGRVSITSKHEALNLNPSTTKNSNYTKNWRVLKTTELDNVRGGPSWLLSRLFTFSLSALQRQSLREYSWRAGEARGPPHPLSTCMNPCKWIGVIGN
jgi:hypothetical protein